MIQKMLGKQKTHRDSDDVVLSMPKPEPFSLRKRSLSVEISDMSNLPASMKIVASICEDGLGLTSWWTSGEEGDDEEQENDQVEAIEE